MKQASMKYKHIGMHVTSSLDLAEHMGAFPTDKKLLKATNGEPLLFNFRLQSVCRLLKHRSKHLALHQPMALGMQACC